MLQIVEESDCQWLEIVNDNVINNKIGQLYLEGTGM